MLVESRISYLPVAEFRHHPFELGGRQAAMGFDNFRFRHDVPKPGLHLRHVFQARHHAKHLAAAETFALDGFADSHMVEGHNKSAHGHAIDRAAWRSRSSRARR